MSRSSTPLRTPTDTSASDVDSEVDSSRPRQAQSNVISGLGLPTKQAARRSRLAAERASESCNRSPTSARRNGPIRANRATPSPAGVKRAMSPPPELQERLPKPRPNPRDHSAVPFNGVDTPSDNSPAEGVRNRDHRGIHVTSQASAPPQPEAPQDIPHWAPLPNANLADILQRLLQHLHAGVPVHSDFLPHLSQDTFIAMETLLTEARVPQVDMQPWQREVYGLLWEIALSLLKVMAAPGSVNLFGQLRANMHRLNDLPEDVSPHRLNEVLDSYDQASQDHWIVELAGFPGDNIEQDLVAAVQERRFDFAVNHMNLGLIMDQKALKTIISRSRYLRLDQRMLMVDFLRAVVQGVAAAKASPVGPEHTHCAIFAARLLFMALTVIVFQDVPEWMKMLVADGDIIRSALAMMMLDDKNLPVSWLDWDMVQRVVYAVAENPNPRFDWFRDLIARRNAENQPAQGLPIVHE